MTHTRHPRATIAPSMSAGQSSNLVNKLDSPEHKNVERLVKQDNESRGGGSNSLFTLWGERGAGSSRLCRQLPNGQEQCAEIALEARDLFQTMQSLGFFCILPHDPAKTYIRCEKIPS